MLASGSSSPEDAPDGKDRVRGDSFTMSRRSISLVLVTTLLVVPRVTVAQSDAGRPDDIIDPPTIYSPYVERTTVDANFAEGVYWGDTHLHSSYSTDAGMMGNTLGPEEAYRFARGEEVVASHGLRVRLIRPLDFLVVADHAENLGLAPFIAESNPELLKSEWGRMVHDLVKAGKSRDAFQAWLKDAVTAGTDPIDNSRMSRTAWDREIAFADQFNEPGRFTALIGFEWTSIATQQASSSRTARTGLGRSCPSAPSIQSIRRICGNTWPTTSRSRAAASSQLPTTAMYPTARCSPSNG
jgi:hypothetical protein